MISVISVVQLGLLDYEEGLRLQKKLVDLRKAGRIGDVLLLLEHTPVVTLGRNAKAGNILASTEELAARGVEAYECDRGGDVTFHGPGQLVGYPILDLRTHELRTLDGGLRSQSVAGRGMGTTTNRKTLGAVDYLRRLEEVLIRTCGGFGIPTTRVASLTGVWTETETSAKIAALGIHISRSVTSHGFALNVNTNLNYFNLIIPCGIAAKPVTSMQKELHRQIDLNDVAHAVSRNFGVVFGSQMLSVETIDELLGNALGVPLKVPEELRKLRAKDDFLVS